MEDVYQLKSCVGGTVSRSALGHGAFITLDIKRPVDQRTFTIWVYLATWAITKEGKEIASSDIDDRSQLENVVSSITGKKLDNIEILNELEYHFEFSDNYELEVWRENEFLSEKSPIMRLYLEADHLGDIVPGSEPG